MTAMDLGTLIETADLTDHVERLMLADALEEAGHPHRSDLCLLRCGLPVELHRHRAGLAVGTEATVPDRLFAAAVVVAMPRDKDSGEADYAWGAHVLGYVAFRDGKVVAEERFPGAGREVERRLADTAAGDARTAGQAIRTAGPAAVRLVTAELAALALVAGQRED